MEDDGEQFRMSERQRVRGTVVAAHFSEACGNLVAKQWRLRTKKASLMQECFFSLYFMPRRKGLL